MKLLRQRLFVGQHFRSAVPRVEGTVIAVWPIEKGSEALIRLFHESTAGTVAVRVFVPFEAKLDRR